MVAVSSIRGGSAQERVHPSPWTPSLSENAISFTIDRDARTHMKIKSRKMYRVEFVASSSWSR